VSDERTIIDASRLRLMLDAAEQKLDVQWKEIRSYRARLIDARREVGVVAATLKMHREHPVCRNLLEELLARLDQTLDTFPEPP
jgi:hypothetical protein